VGIARDIKLGFDEEIECSDSGLLHGLHGTRAVENEGDFGELWVYRRPNPATGGTFVGSVG
jgi:hypothetical protein